MATKSRFLIELQAGVLPVFVVDGTFPPEKLAVRMERLTLMSTSNILPNPQEFVTGESNIACNNGFQRRIDECVVSGARTKL